jgi:hypothetical protein
LSSEIKDGFTISAWIKPTTVSREMLIAEFERKLGTFNGSDVGLDFAIQRVNGSDGWCLYANLPAAGSSHRLASAPNLLVARTWQHVALTYDKSSGAAALYLNGKVAAQETFDSFNPPTNLPYLLVGAKTTFGSVTNPKSAFSGEIDEFGIYNRALSPGEVQTIYEEANVSSTAH